MHKNKTTSPKLPVWEKLSNIFLKNILFFTIFGIIFVGSLFLYNEVFHPKAYITPGRITAYFVPLIILPFVGYILYTQYQKIENLAIGTQQISKVLVDVICKKQLGIRYKNPYLVHCWEIKNCNKSDCPAYNSKDSRCWQITGTFCDKNPPDTLIERKIEDCKLCPIYKICTPDEFTAIGEDFNNMMLVLEHMTAQQYQDFMNTISALSKLIEMKDPYTVGRHSHTVQKYAVGTAKHLNLTLEQIENIKIASILHDIGKIGVRGAILNKNGPLEKIEYEEIKKHPLIGADALKSIEKLKYICTVVRYHHERYDGKMDEKYSAYTGEVKGEDIPIEARIITVVDSYDAMTSDRPYRKALSAEDALKIIKGESGKQFDPNVVEAFLKFLADEKSKQDSRVT